MFGSTSKILQQYCLLQDVPCPHISLVALYKGCCVQYCTVYTVLSFTPLHCPVLLYYTLQCTRYCLDYCAVQCIILHYCIVLVYTLHCTVHYTALYFTYCTLSYTVLYTVLYSSLCGLFREHGVRGSQLPCPKILAGFKAFNFRQTQVRYRSTCGGTSPHPPFSSTPQPSPCD